MTRRLSRLTTSSNNVAVTNRLLAIVDDFLNGHPKAKAVQPFTPTIEHALQNREEIARPARLKRPDDGRPRLSCHPPLGRFLLKAASYDIKTCLSLPPSFR